MLMADDQLFSLPLVLAVAAGAGVFWCMLRLVKRGCPP